MLNRSALIALGAIALATGACATTRPEPMSQALSTVVASVMIDPAQATSVTRDAIAAGQVSAAEITEVAVSSAPDRAVAITRAAVSAAPEDESEIRSAARRAIWSQPARPVASIPRPSEIEDHVNRTAR
jgi:hypothetical protein